MKNITQHTGKLEILGRLPSSSFGNPRYKLTIGGFYCVTAVDSSHGYKVPNLEGKIVTATIGIHYNSPTLNTIEKE